MASRMGETSRTDSGDARESARLLLCDLRQLSEELAHRSALLRSEGYRILAEILDELEAEVSPEASSGKSTRSPFSHSASTIRAQLQSDWLRVDCLIDNLVSSAANEIAHFASVAESRIGAVERAARHERARDRIENRD